MRLISARDYFARYFDCPTDQELRKVIYAWSDRLYVMLEQYPVWLTRDNGSPEGLKDFIIKEEDPVFHRKSCADTVAYQRHAIDVTVAEHYALKGQKLKHPLLPPLVIENCAQTHRTFLPLEKLYLHPAWAGHEYDKKPKAPLEEFILFGRGTIPEDLEVHPRKRWNRRVFQPDLIRWDQPL